MKLLILIFLISCSKVNIDIKSAFSVQPAGFSISNLNIPSGQYFEGDELNISVNYNEIVTVTGTPAIELNIGGTPVIAYYVSGSGTNSLLFRYTVVSNIAGASPVISSPINISGGSIQNESGVNAPINFSTPDTSDVAVDGRKLTVEFSKTNYSVPEESGTARTLTLNINPAPVADTVIPLSFFGNADSLNDYEFPSSSVTIPSGQTSVAIPYDVLDNSIVDPNRSFTVAVEKQALRTNISLGELFFFKGQNSRR
jgi:hypothetical protein